MKTTGDAKLTVVEMYWLYTEKEALRQVSKENVEDEKRVGSGR